MLFVILAFAMSTPAGSVDQADDSAAVTFRGGVAHCYAAPDWRGFWVTVTAPGETTEQIVAFTDHI
jgi:hypothetical protein